MHRLQFLWPIPISDFWELWPADTDFSRFLSKDYNWQHMQIKSMQIIKQIFYIINKWLNITIPPIWTNLLIFSHLNNSQNKVLCDWKEEKIVNLKLVAIYTVYIYIYIYM